MFPSALSIYTDKADSKHMADKLDTVIGAAVAGVVGVILLCSMVIPIAVQQIHGLSSIPNITSDQVNSFSSLLGVVIIMLIVGLIIAIIRHYQGSGSR